MLNLLYMWTGLDVTSTTLLVEPSVLDAMLQGNLLATNIHISQMLFNFWPALQSKEIMKKFRRKKKENRWLWHPRMIMIIIIARLDRSVYFFNLDINYGFSSTS
ncbi:hypothetical protein Dsin_017082 [Dipteronia sinensis]|uniref:Uncharacterized protein n=1 Tax=Dipteronia sinensis TaxID=43782 RepID=A0AAE0E634_9ROSI|nr:hypothetical protein Dsin_017082 [Dipteronia sinensis]